MNVDTNHDIVPSLRMFDGLITSMAADEIEMLRGLMLAAKTHFQILGENLKFQRELRGISLEYAAYAADMPSALLERTESGQPGISTLQITKLSRLYMKPVADLFEADA